MSHLDHHDPTDAEVADASASIVNAIQRQQQEQHGAVTPIAPELLQDALAAAHAEHGHVGHPDHHDHDHDHNHDHDHGHETDNDVGAGIDVADPDGDWTNINMASPFLHPSDSYLMHATNGQEQGQVGVGAHDHGEDQHHDHAQHGDDPSHPHAHVHEHSEPYGKEDIYAYAGQYMNVDDGLGDAMHAYAPGLAASGSGSQVGSKRSRSPSLGTADIGVGSAAGSGVGVGVGLGHGMDGASADGHDLGDMSASAVNASGSLQNVGRVGVGNVGGVGVGVGVGLGVGVGAGTGAGTGSAGIGESDDQAQDHSQVEHDHAGLGAEGDGTDGGDPDAESSAAAAAAAAAAGGYPQADGSSLGEATPNPNKRKRGPRAMRNKPPMQYWTDPSIKHLNLPATYEGRAIEYSRDADGKDGPVFVHPAPGTVQACIRCHTIKRKCDALEFDNATQIWTKAKCSGCEKSEIPCVFELAAASSGFVLSLRSDYARLSAQLEATQRRVQELEVELQQPQA